MNVELECADPRELADVKRAMRITGQSRTYIYAHMREGAEPPFPSSFPIGNRVFFRVADLYDWNQKRFEESQRDQ